MVGVEFFRQLKGDFLNSFHCREPCGSGPQGRLRIKRRADFQVLVLLVALIAAWCIRLLWKDLRCCSVDMT